MLVDVADDLPVIRDNHPKLVAVIGWLWQTWGQGRVTAEPT